MNGIKPGSSSSCLPFGCGRDNWSLLEAFWKMPALGSDVGSGTLLSWARDNQLSVLNRERMVERKKDFPGPSHLPSTPWPWRWCLGCIWLCGSFSVYRLLSRSELSVFSLRGYSFYCTCPGRNWDRIVISWSHPRLEGSGLRGLFCCVSVHFLFWFGFALLKWPWGVPWVPKSNALSVSVKLGAGPRPIAVWFYPGGKWNIKEHHLWSCKFQRTRLMVTTEICF